MKKVNKKGFTLIELIIVATIMVMVMGAILNFIRPVNKFYERTQAMDDTNDIGSILMDNVDDELRYATNVVVLQDYKGVPQLIDGFLVDSTSKPFVTAKLTDVLIIDNNAIRGSQLAGYDAQGTVAHRKGAKGCILRARINDAGIDIDKMGILRSEDLYNDYGCKFDASMKTLDNGKSKCLTLDIELMRPSREGLSYEFKKVVYNQSRDFELVNINLDEASQKNMKGYFYSSRDNALNPIDYNNLVQSSNVGSLGSNHLDETGTYTYILYTREKPSSEKVQILLKNSETKALLDTQTISSGSSISDSIYNSWMDIGKKNQKMDYATNTFLHFNGISSENNEPIDYYRSAPISNKLVFYCNYTSEVLNKPTGQFLFRDRFDDHHIDHTGQTPPYWEDTADFYSEADGFTGTVDFHRGNGDDPKVGAYKFIGWNTKPDATGAPSGDPDPKAVAADIKAGWFVSGAKYTSVDTYYAIYEQKDIVAFNVAGFSSTTSITIVDGYTSDDYKNDSRFQQLIQEAKDNAPAGQVFENLHVFDAADKDLGVFGSDPNIFEKYSKGGFTIKPIYKECAYEGTYEVTITIEDINPWYNSLAIQGSPAHFVLCEEDGTTEIVSETAENYKQIVNVFSPGQVLKLYIYDNASVSVSFNNSSVTVNDNCACVYDGNSLRVN